MREHINSVISLGILFFYEEKVSVYVASEFRKITLVNAMSVRNDHTLLCLPEYLGQLDNRYLSGIDECFEDIACTDRGELIGITDKDGRSRWADRFASTDS